jgi:phosphonate metabolism protein (transferase hexapeptide repeat family)
MKEKIINSKGLIGQRVFLNNVALGEYTEIGDDSHFEQVEFGAFSYCGPRCIIQNSKILNFSNIAAHVRIGPTDHPMDRPTLHHFTYRRRLYGFAEEDDQEFFYARSCRITILGHDTWLGHNVIVKPGITIGNGAVVGSGSVVTKDLPPYSVSVGVPAKVIRFRFLPEEIQALEEIQWWHWNWAMIKKRVKDFSLPIGQFITKYRVSI